MHHEMRARLCLFAKYISMTCFFIFDYFLFSTGNPSITYSLLGGWFEVALAGIFITPVWYFFMIGGNKKVRKLIGLHVFISCFFGLILFSISAAARNFAEKNIRNQVYKFTENPVSAVVVASGESRRLMAQIAENGYVIQPEGFIPVFRRDDFLLHAQTGKRYRLIAVMDWKDMAHISMRELSGHEN